MFTTEDAADALVAAGIDISSERYVLEDVRDGMNVELEHGTRFPDLDVMAPSWFNCQLKRTFYVNGGPDEPDHYEYGIRIRLTEDSTPLLSPRSFNPLRVRLLWRTELDPKDTG